MADVPRTGQWSSECYRCDWLGTPGARVGARFRGYNRVGRMRWSRICEITEAEPATTLTWKTVPVWLPTQRDSVTWGYSISPDGAGSLVTLAAHQTIPPMAWFQRVIARTMPHHLDLQPVMRETLGRIRQLVQH